MDNTNTILTVMVAITGVSVLLQFIVLFGILLTARKSVTMAREYYEDIRSAIVPVLHHSQELMQTTQELIARLEPRLDAAATDMAEMARIAREQTERIQASADEINERVRRQAKRIDSMTTTTLNGVERVGHFVNESVSAPIRQVSGILAAARAVIETLRAPAPPRQRPSQAPAPAQDESSQFV